MCLCIGLSSFFLVLPFYFLLRLWSQLEIPEFSLSKIFIFPFWWLSYNKHSISHQFHPFLYRLGIRLRSSSVALRIQLLLLLLVIFDKLLSSPPLPYTVCVEMQAFERAVMLQAEDEKRKKMETIGKVPQAGENI